MGEPSPDSDDIEVSVVIPCLNEAETLAVCIQKARRSFEANGLRGEVIIADNGSSDGSPEIATAKGARVVNVVERGYGNALMGGIAAARGRFVVMGDADDSYDFLETHRFVEKLREGNDLVQGCRFPSGGGRVAPGAMPFLHRWIGNPLLSLLARILFRTRIRDIYCGFRGFTSDWYRGLNLQCTGMEFATEMIVKSTTLGGRIGEIPITLSPDGRITRKPHLRTFRDGWRTLRFYLLYSPRWIFLYPSLLLGAAGALGYAVAMPGLTLHRVTFDVHTLLVSSLLLLMSFNAFLLGVSAKVFAIGAHMIPLDRKTERFFAVATLERGLVLSLLVLLGGALLIAAAVKRWYDVSWGPLDYASTMRLLIPGFTLAAIGFQAFLSSFLISIMGIRRR